MDDPVVAGVVLPFLISAVIVVAISHALRRENKIVRIFVASACGLALMFALFALAVRLGVYS